MSSLLLVLIFLLTIFMITQFFLNQLVSSKDSALENLRSQIAELVSQLALERREKADLQATIMSLQDSLAAASAEQERLAALADQGAGAGSRIAELESALSDEKKVSNEALAQVELLNQQISALRRQLATLEAALEAAEQKDREQQVQIADLGRRLNAALAQKVQELAKYRSEFFGLARHSRRPAGHRDCRRSLCHAVGNLLRVGLGGHQSGGRAAARQDRNRNPRDRGGNSGRYPLGTPRRRPYGREPDLDAAIPLELVSSRAPAPSRS